MHTAIGQKVISVQFVENREALHSYNQPAILLDEVQYCNFRCI